MDPKSLISIEYIHILNSGIKTPECGMKPPTPPTQKPSDSNNPQTWWWIILGLCLAIILVLITLIGVYYILENRRSRSHDCTNK